VSDDPDGAHVTKVSSMYIVSGRRQHQLSFSVYSTTETLVKSIARTTQQVRTRYYSTICLGWPITGWAGIIWINGGSAVHTSPPRAALSLAAALFTWAPRRLPQLVAFLS
jgi:hypothetical protein